MRNKFRYSKFFYSLWAKLGLTLLLANYILKSQKCVCGWGFIPCSEPFCFHGKRLQERKNAKQESMAFFENITIGQYVPRDSLIHNLDPRTKILLIFSWLVIAAITVNPKIYLLLLSSILLVFFLSNLPLSFLFKNLKSFIWLFVLIFIKNRKKLLEIYNKY